MFENFEVINQDVTELATAYPAAAAAIARRYGAVEPDAVSREELRSGPQGIVAL
jgi:hypothetical protein